MHETKVHRDRIMRLDLLSLSVRMIRKCAGHPRCSAGVPVSCASWRKMASATPGSGRLGCVPSVLRAMREHSFPDLHRWGVWRYSKLGLQRRRSSRPPYLLSDIVRHSSVTLQRCHFCNAVVGIFGLRGHVNSRGRSVTLFGHRFCPLGCGRSLLAALCSLLPHPPPHLSSSLRVSPTSLFSHRISESLVKKDDKKKRISENYLCNFVEFDSRRHCGVPAVG